MANTFSQIYLQFVFAVKHRENLVAKQYKFAINRVLLLLSQQYLVLSQNSEFLVKY
ncbi:hypothetical protein Mucpa_6419 [Mucilaginibacter paludis DSM 18603]|uniref:Uncharacterized protein n=1 Tax=Mucilaginibacter paludis DSM 18603 TaxID=714943 RepID=H1Y7Y6_9SPHI|nr:hypothetical protein Mucpa_6419 [Mucilaginibacter paludis DSM 18603]